jgi:hypothetical protein
MFVVSLQWACVSRIEVNPNTDLFTKIYYTSDIKAMYVTSDIGSTVILLPGKISWEKCF